MRLFAAVRRDSNDIADALEKGMVVLFVVEVMTKKEHYFGNLFRKGPSLVL